MAAKKQVTFSDLNMTCKIGIAGGYVYFGMFVIGIIALFLGW